MNCYTCAGKTLKPIKLEEGLAARSCDTCGGIHIDLLAYRAWSEDVRLLHDPEEVHPTPIEVDDNQKALLCQRCEKLMTKYRISSSGPNFIDLCASCDDVWLDEGEWQLLGQLNLQGKLTNIATEPWQRSVRATAIAQSSKDHLMDILGEDLNQAQDFADWVKSHPQRSLLFKFLKNEIGE